MMPLAETSLQNFTSPLIASKALPMVIVIEVLVVVGNPAVICAVSRSPTLRNTRNAFVVNLAIADLFYGTFGRLAMLLIIWNSALYFQPTPTCVFSITVGTMGVVSVSLSLLGAPTGRVIPLLYPLRSASIMTKRRVAIITCCWAVTLLVTVSPLIVPWNPGVQDACGGRVSVAVAFLNCSIVFLLSAIGNIAIHVVTYIIARKHSRAIKKITQLSEQSMQFTKEIVAVSRASKVLMAAVVCSLVFCIPLLAVEYTLLFSKDVLNSWIVKWHIIYFVPAISSSACAINPWIYSLRTKEMRRILFSPFIRVTDYIRSWKNLNTVAPD